jgi:PAS domain S-box-containing protein
MTKNIDQLTGNHYRELADLLPQTVFEMGERGRLTFVNQHALQVFGYTKEEFENGLTALQMIIPEQQGLAIENLEASLRGEHFGHEYTMRRKDGSTFPAIIHSSPIIRDGFPVGLRGIIVDISERKRMEQALQENELLLRTLVDNMLDATLILDWGGNVLFANNAAVKLVDLASPIDGKNFNIQDFLHPDHKQAALDHLDLVNKNKGGFLWQYKIITGAGRERWVESLGTKIQFNGSSANVVNLRDITERKQSEETLRETVDKYRNIFKNAVEGIFQSTPEGRFIDVNPALARMMGFQSPEEMIQGFTDIAYQHYVRPEERIKYRDLLERNGVIKGFETEVYGKDKNTIWISINARAVRDKNDNILYYEGTVENITERKQVADSLRVLEELESSILSAIPHAVIGLKERAIFFANDAVETVFGWTPKELIGANTRALYRSDEEYQEIGRHFYPALAKQRFHREEFHCRRKDGKDIVCMVSTARIGNDLTDKKIVAIYEDVTEHRQAEAQIKESEERYRVAIEHSNDGVAIVKGNNHQYVNKRFVEIFGYDQPNEILGKPLGFTIHPDDLERVAAINQGRQSGVVVPDRYEFKGIKKDGEPVFIEASVTNVIYLGETASLAYLRDITERKRTEMEKGHLEAQLRQAQKMEAIGQLAGGVAHDFNNILTAVIGYGNLLQAKMTQDDPLRPYIEQILASAGKAVNLTQSLLAFGRKQIIELRPCKLSTLIKNVEKLLSRLLTEDIELLTFVDASDPTIMADPTQIDQILINFSTNARDAMPNGGILKIEVKLTEINRAFVAAYGYGEIGKYALISVSDTGVGMDTKTKEKIFDPFFTTKEVGKGTGLGLSIVYGVVKQHNGYINVESEPGRGTTFHIYLPIVKMKEEEKKANTPGAQGGTETILIGEDNSSVRELSKEVLGQFGYTVIEARDGEDAISKFKQFAQNIDLVILDVVMPKKNGREVYEAIRVISPEIKVFFMSGYTADILSDKGMHGKKLDYIPKPLSPQELLNKVRAVLDSK